MLGAAASLPQPKRRLGESQFFLTTVSCESGGFCRRIPIPSVTMVGSCAVVFVTRFTVYERLKHPNLDLLSLRFTTAFMTLLGEEIPLLGNGILVVIL